MPKLLKRKRPFPWEEETCNECHKPLVVKDTIVYGKHYWCSKCKDWRYPEAYNKKIVKIEPDIVLLDTSDLKLKIDAYEEKLISENRIKLTVYSAEEYNQEFLLSLIPKR